MRSDNDSENEWLNELPGWRSINECMSHRLATIYKCLTATALANSLCVVCLLHHGEVIGCERFLEDKGPQPTGDEANMAIDRKNETQVKETYRNDLISHPERHGLPISTTPLPRDARKFEESVNRFPILPSVFPLRK